MSIKRLLWERHVSSYTNKGYWPLNNNSRVLYNSIYTISDFNVIVPESIFFFVCPLIFGETTHQQCTSKYKRTKAIYTFHKRVRCQPTAEQLTFELNLPTTNFFWHLTCQLNMVRLYFPDARAFCYYKISISFSLAIFLYAPRMIIIQFFSFKRRTTNK